MADGPALAPSSETEARLSQVWHRLSWDDLRAFLAISVHGSMNRAAPVLRESQPTLGRRMLRLERDIGFPLFERAPNRLVPTEAGEALAAALMPMLGAARSLASLSERFTPDVARPIRITATTTLALFLSEHVATLRAAAPERDVVLVPTRQRFDLLRGEAEIALRMNSVEPEAGLLARKAATVSFAFYGLRGAGNLPMIMPSGDSTMSKHRALANRELAHRAQGPQIDELHLRYQAIRAGAGIGALPCWLGHGDAGLECLSLRADQFIHEDVFLVRTERSRADRAIDAVARELAAILRRNRARLKVTPEVVTPPLGLASSVPR
jgi:DNA-binding transcriptional LysR family regulator